MSTSDVPDGCVLIQAELIRKGDTVRFRDSRFNYLVEATEINNIGHIAHRFNGDTGYSSYHPGELLWITRRDKT